jgi:hypothetical protein
MTTTPPSRLPPDEDETNGMPPPDAGTPWTPRPPSGIPPEAIAYLEMLENRPAGNPPGYVPPAYAPLAASRASSRSTSIPVGRRQGRVQEVGYRRPFDFAHAHGVFFRVRFESLPIPDHALGVAYLNYEDRKWLFGRRVGNYYHVEYHSGSPRTKCILHRGSASFARRHSPEWERINSTSRVGTTSAGIGADTVKGESCCCECDARSGSRPLEGGPPRVQRRPCLTRSAGSSCGDGSGT